MYTDFSEDLAEDTVKKTKEKLNELKEAKKQGKIAYFALDKLIIKNKRSFGNG